MPSGPTDCIVAVDLEGGEIRLNAGETKNQEPRTISLLRELRDMLKIEREKNSDAEFVFIRSHQPISSFKKAWKSACDRAKLPGLLFHDFRRTRVRNLVRAGVPERVAMAISGHKTQAVFKKTRWFRAGQRWRTGCEGRISVLKRRHG
jgi:integrase